MSLQIGDVVKVKNKYLPIKIILRDRTRVVGKSVCSIMNCSSREECGGYRITLAGYPDNWCAFWMEKIGARTKKRLSSNSSLRLPKRTEFLQIIQR